DRRVARFARRSRLFSGSPPNKKLCLSTERVDRTFGGGFFTADSRFCGMLPLARRGQRCSRAKVVCCSSFFGQYASVGRNCKNGPESTAAEGGAARRGARRAAREHNARSPHASEP